MPLPTGLPENEFSRTLSGAEILQLLSHGLRAQSEFRNSLFRKRRVEDCGKGLCARKMQTTGAEAQIYFQGLAARLNVVPFPSPRAAAPRLAPERWARTWGIIIWLVPHARSSKLRGHFKYRTVAVRAASVRCAVEIALLIQD